MSSGFELNNFGSLLSFAIQLEETAGTFYDSLAGSSHPSISRDVLKGLSDDNKKRKLLLERTRRENVVEMVLECISGLDAREYAINLLCTADVDEASALRTVLTIEERMEKFYSDSSNKTRFLPELSRTLSRLARGNADRRSRVQET